MYIIPILGLNVCKLGFLEPQAILTIPTTETIATLCIWVLWTLTLRLTIVQKTYMIWFLGPKALTNKSLEP